MNPYRALVDRIGGTRPFGWFGRKVLTPVDTMMKGKRRSLTTLGTGFPLCYLTTTGRSSGEPRTSPLLYVPAGEVAVAVVGSNWGTPHHPGWTYNLLADPHATLSVAGADTQVKARVVEDPSERAELWLRFESVYRGYRAYRRRTSRDIRMFVLEPSESS